MAGSNHATIGCAFSSDDAAIGALRALSDAGLASAWRIGATDGGRAEKIAQAVGGRGDLDPADPLGGVAGLASGAKAQSGVNTGALVGGGIGVAAGIASAWTPLAAIMPVDPAMQGLAATLLFFIAGAALGGVLGGALGKRPSTHAGFRLIDAMEAGDVAAVASVDAVHTDEVRRALEKESATDVTVIAY